MTNDPARAERSDNIDIGLTVKPVDGLTVGFSGFYKWAENYLDKGQFGALVFQTAFNYSNAQVRGFELFANYDKGPWSLYANLALVAGQLDQHQPRRSSISSRRSWTTSPATGSSPTTTRAGRARLGAAYVFNMDSDWATRVSADVLYGIGLRQTIVTLNDTALPAYATLNLSVTQRLLINGSKGTNVRFDAINVTDASINFEPVPVSAWARASIRHATAFVTMSRTKF